MNITSFNIRTQTCHTRVILLLQARRLTLNLESPPARSGKELQSPRATQQCPYSNINPCEYNRIRRSTENPEYWKGSSVAHTWVPSSLRHLYKNSPESTHAKFKLSSWGPDEHYLYVCPCKYLFIASEYKQWCFSIKGFRFIACGQTILNTACLKASSQFLLY